MNVNVCIDDEIMLQKPDEKKIITISKCDCQ